MFSIMQVLKPEIRADILLASGQLFFERGYRGTTMRAVADRVGVSASNLYKYFRDKDDLFEAVVGSYALAFKSGLRRHLAHAPDEETDAERIGGMVDGLAAAINADARAFSILMTGSEASAYAGFRGECSTLLSGHMEAGTAEADGAAEMVGIVVSNLLGAVVEVARRHGGTPALLPRLHLLFRYHMAGFAALT